MKNFSAISVSNFFKQKEITAKEIKDHFILIKEFQLDVIHNKGCPNCGDTCNQYDYKSEPWTGVTHCMKCDSVILVFYSDRMGGINTDTVMVFKQNAVETQKVIIEECLKCQASPYYFATNYIIVKNEKGETSKFDTPLDEKTFNALVESYNFVKNKSNGGDTD